MNPSFNGSYFLHESNPLTNVVFDENVQPKVYTFAQKSKSQEDEHQTQQDTGKTINESPLTHPLFSFAETLSINEDSQRKPICN